MSGKARPRGVWDAATVYDPFDVVYHKGEYPDPGANWVTLNGADAGEVPGESRKWVKYVDIERAPALRRDPLWA